MNRNEWNTCAPIFTRLEDELNEKEFNKKSRRVFDKTNTMCWTT